MKSNEIVPELSDYCCPKCSSQLVIEWGNTIHRGDRAYGGFLVCRAPSSKCNTPENVSGHGTGRSESTILSNAYKIIMAKYTGASVDLSEEQRAEPEDKLPEITTTIKSKPTKKSKKSLPVVAIEDDENAI
jgi:hypothetical protein